MHPSVNCEAHPALRIILDSRLIDAGQNTKQHHTWHAGEKISPRPSSSYPENLQSDYLLQPTTHKPPNHVDPVAQPVPDMQVRMG